MAGSLKMKDMIKYGFVLALICLVSASLLAAVNNATEEVILERKFAEEKAALKELFPEAYEFDSVRSEDKKAYIALDENEKPLGYAFKTKAQGYSSEIDTLVAVDLKDTIINVKILSQNETPGVGSRITEPQFINKFIGERLGPTLLVHTITGATISSSALIESIEKNAQAIKSLVHNQLKQYEE